MIIAQPTISERKRLLPRKKMSIAHVMKATRVPAAVKIETCVK